MEKIQLINLYGDRISAYINKMTFEAESVIRKNIPEETYTLQQDTKRELAKKEGNVISGRIYTDSSGESKDYQEIVHWGGITEKSYYKGNGRKTGGSPFLVTADGTQFITKGIKYLEDNY